MVSFFLAITFISCQKDFGDLGSKVQPESDKIIINYTDTTICKAYTLTDDSVIISNQSVNLLGSYFDPIFGTSTASFLTQVSLQNTAFPDYDTFDSVYLVLHLYYNSVYRHTDSLEGVVDQYINIYELNEIIPGDTNLLDNINPEEFYDESVSLGRYKLEPDSLNYFSFRLPDELANRLISADSADLVDNDAFVQFFKGFYIQSEPVSEGGVIYNIHSESVLSELTLYYTDTISKTYNFAIDQVANKVNIFNHDYSNIPGINDENIEYSKAYIQSMSGLKVKIKIPGLSSWAEFYDSEKIIINKAEFVFSINENESYFDEYLPNNDLVLSAINIEDSSKQLIPSYLKLNSSGYYQYVGESYDPETNGYTFNITSYFQSIIMTNTETLGFYLYTANSATTANRVVLNSGNNSDPIKLKITYSKLQ